MCLSKIVVVLTCQLTKSKLSLFSKGMIFLRFVGTGITIYIKVADLRTHCTYTVAQDCNVPAYRLYF